MFNDSTRQRVPGLSIAVDTILWKIMYNDRRTWSGCIRSIADVYDLGGRHSKPGQPPHIVVSVDLGDLLPAQAVAT